MLKAEIIGNLGSDAEIRIINEKKYVAFSVAHSERRIDANGVPIEKTTWVSVLKPGDGGKFIQYLKKGTKVFVRGGIYTKIYNDQNGVPHVAININADDIQLCCLPPQKQVQGQGAVQQEQYNEDIDWDKGGSDDLPY